MEDTTVVLFRILDGDVIAVFPEMPGDSQGLMMNSYMHVGQHGAASADIIDRTKPATPEQYEPLRRELEAIGYVLDIRQRTPKDAADKRRQAVKYEWSWTGPLVKIISSRAVTNCPVMSLSPEHYNDDGTCKCMEEQQAN